MTSVTVLPCAVVTGAEHIWTIVVGGGSGQRFGTLKQYERLGERPAAVGRLLVAPDTSATRRRIADHAETFARAYPLRGRAVSRWLAQPRDAMAGVLLLPPGVTRSRRRVRVTRAADEGPRP